MKLGIVLSTTEPETLFNALRLGNYAAGQGDSVRVFLLGKGVELDQIEDEKFNVRQQAESLVGYDAPVVAHPRRHRHLGPGVAGGARESQAVRAEIPVLGDEEEDLGHQLSAVSYQLSAVNSLIAES